MIIYILYRYRQPPRLPMYQQQPTVNEILRKEDICVYFSSMNRKRKRNLTKALDIIGLPYEHDGGIMNGPMMIRGYKHILNKLENFRNSTYKYAIICDDDFYPINDFWNKLNTTVQQIGKDFRCLHLCPGCLWGRGSGNITGRLNTKKNLSGMAHNEYTFHNINNDEWSKQGMWLGGPAAFLINKTHIDSFISDYTSFYKGSKTPPNDVIFVSMLNDKDYVCREPQLCYEREEGISTNWGDKV